MNEKNLRIGAKLRHARKVKGYRLADLAERVGCSEGFLSKLENNKVKPSLQLLHKIVGELNTSIGSLFEAEHESDGVVMRKGKRRRIHTGAFRRAEGVSIECLVPNPEVRLLYGAIHIVAPGGGSEGHITHEGEEVGFILEGELNLEVNGESYHLAQGDSFFFQSDLPHGYRNPTDRTTRILWVNTPSTF